MYVFCFNVCIQHQAIANDPISSSRGVSRISPGTNSRYFLVTSSSSSFYLIRYPKYLLSTAPYLHQTTTARKNQIAYLFVLFRIKLCLCIATRYVPSQFFRQRQFNLKDIHGALFPLVIFHNTPHRYSFAMMMGAFYSPNLNRDPMVSTL